MRTVLLLWLWPMVCWALAEHGSTPAAGFGQQAHCRMSSSAPEKRVAKASIVVKALVTNTYPDQHFHQGYVAEIWLLDVYKGADKLAATLGLTAQDENIADLKDRQVNVSRWGDASRCWNSLEKQKTYILMLTSGKDAFIKNTSDQKSHHAVLEAKYDEHFGAAVDFSADLEEKILSKLGWNSWSDWNSCSASCGGGFQIRQRTCALPSSPGTCPTYNVEKRTCNSFSCIGATNTLRVTEERYYKPSISAFEDVPDRTAAAWRIKQGSYLLLPFKEAFGIDFPNDFTIFLTIKPARETEGIIFSLNARHSRQEYLSLEMKKRSRLELIHSLPNGTKIIDIPAAIDDGKWHQMAISIQGGSSVRTYLDCQWIATQILHRHSLVVPKNLDLIIGYMFQGELEQLTVSKMRHSAEEQCSSNRTPFRDENLMSQSTSSLFKNPPKQISLLKDQKKGHHPLRLSDKDYLAEEYVDLDYKDADESPVRSTKRGLVRFDDNKMIWTEDSSIESSGEDDPDEMVEHGSGGFDLEWSSWSTCSVTCGQGQQQRTSRCVDNLRMSDCLASKVEHSETRACFKLPCAPVIQPEYELVTESEVEATRLRSKAQLSPPLNSHQNSSRQWQHHRSITTKLRGTKKKHHLEGKMIDEEHCDYCKNQGRCLSGRESCICKKGFTGSRCEKAICKPPCENGGQCVKPDICSCQDGFTGARCQQAFCYPTCENGGICVAPFRCRCPVGTSGLHCQDFLCEPKCENGGVCAGADTCACPKGFTGARCEDVAESSCTADCENGGQCVMPGHKCLCKPGYYGARCHKKICHRYVAIRKPRRRLFKKAMSVEYDSICQQGVEWVKCKKTRPEYRTVNRVSYKTTYICLDERSEQSGESIKEANSE